MALVRRAYYDLTGLPPTPEQVDAFVNDPSAGAWEKLIDRLLDSARSTARSGAGTGSTWCASPRPTATSATAPSRSPGASATTSSRASTTTSRSTSSSASNSPETSCPAINPDAVIATGFYRLGLWDDEPADPQQARFDELDDFVTTTGQGFLGMSLNCARCHDHKRDPIPQADYYRLLAFFADVQRYDNNRDTRSAVALTDVTPRTTAPPTKQT